MAPASSSGLITPLEPDRATRRAAASSAVGILQAVYSNAFRRLEAAVASSCGRHRVNEDAHSPLEGDGHLFVVADGVGGGAMAQLASRLLVAHLHESLEARPLEADRISDAVLSADRAIASAIARVTDRPGASTVALCAPLDRFAAKWMLAWVGDCRAYRWSPQAQRLEVLTRDDTFANLGEAPPAGGAADDPARMVGNGATSGANAAVHALACGEMLALCSDGIHKYLKDSDWCGLLDSPLPLARRAEQLVARARANASVDDATLLLIERSTPVWPGRSRTTQDRGGSPRSES
jgi:serine/threonine protein phosphatase PrpC